MLRCHLGIVDSGYRGEITVWINNYGKDGHYIKKGDKVCQILFVLTPQVKLQEVSELEDSERGTNGHGSSGR
jgi:dUTP pyrophosphatase